jgi:hypothetical protein
MNSMFSVTAMAIAPGSTFALYAPFVVIAAVVVLTIMWYVREGRHAALEQIVTSRSFGAAAAFRGTLDVEEDRPGTYLRLGKTTKEAGAWQFWFRWIAGSGKQPIYDEVTFDGPGRRVELRKKANCRTFEISEISAIKMRERKAGKNGSVTWRLDLIPREGKSVPFLTSAIGYRKEMFERSAAVAKAAAAIVHVPVQVHVAGNVWTPGWPPKKDAIIV